MVLDSRRVAAAGSDVKGGVGALTTEWNANLEKVRIVSSKEPVHDQGLQPHVN